MFKVNNTNTKTRYETFREIPERHQLTSFWYRNIDWGRKCLVLFNSGKSQLDSFDQFNNCGAIDVITSGCALEVTSSFKILGSFSSKLDWGFYVVSIAKNSSKKIGVLIRSMKFLSLEVAICLYKFN